MKILKAFLIVIIGIIVLAMVAALFISKDYAVEREVTINKPKQEVFDYIKLLKNQDHYSIFNQLDPAMKKTYHGIDGTVGFVYAWDSEKKEAGKGEQEISKITEGERIDMLLRFKEPFEANDNAYMTTEAVSDSLTKVKWGFSGHMNYPMNLMPVLMNMEKSLGKALQDGLNNLKTTLEK
ncbi:MAG TPA: SRPBCC family protein [Pedobacter sp.]|nr:SRPBCC family protein [Pedobacter sp.]